MATQSSDNTFEFIHETVGFIGAGNMAQAIAFPLMAKGVLKPSNVIVSATSENNLPTWRTTHGCSTTTQNVEVFQKSQILIWAVKPQMFPGVVNCLICALKKKTNSGKPTVHISIMGGISVSSFRDQIQKLDEEPLRCFRVMPNIGHKVSCGVAVYSSLSTLTEEERLMFDKLFKPIGMVYEVPDQHINAYCGLFGSGIGFMFPIIEALSDGAVKMGIPRKNSLEIAAQVMKGAGELVLQEKLHPGVMKDQVCSPGGTTIAGIAALEDGGVRSAIIKAVEAATVRGDILGGATSSSKLS